MKLRHLFLLSLCWMTALTAAPQSSDDCGLQLSAGASHKFNKKWSADIEAGLRTRNDFRTLDRWSLDLGIGYKVNKYLKLSAGYALLYDNNEEKITYDAFGEISKWRPSYWGLRHRFNVSATGSVGLGRFSLSLRERWQYTYRPEKTVDRYDFSDEEWQDKVMAATNKHILRSRLKVDYDIAKCKVDPYASVELFNSMRLQKTRLVLGAEWKINKRQSLDVFYRFQFTHNDDDNEGNSHIIGLSYNIKF